MALTEHSSLRLNGGHWRVTHALAIVATLFVASSAFGAITVTPATPRTGDVVTIRVTNQFGAEASVESASITRAGNDFVIDQTVAIACSLPSNPTVASQFVVGPLPPGAYNVTAHITFRGVLCSPPNPVTQTSAFVVNAEVPTLSLQHLLLLAALLAAGGVALTSGRG